jgi:hypothetical protein
MCPVWQLNAWKGRDPRRVGHITGAGTLHGQSPGRHSDPPLEGSLCRCDVQRRRACQNIPGIVKTIPGSGENRSPSRRNHCSPSARNPVRLHPGIVFTIAPESFSPCSGIRTSAGSAGSQEDSRCYADSGGIANAVGRGKSQLGRVGLATAVMSVPYEKEATPKNRAVQADPFCPRPLVFRLSFLGFVARWNMISSWPPVQGRSASTLSQVNFPLGEYSR